MTGTKLCLRKCGSRECSNHTPGHPLVTDNTLYVRSATSGTALTTMFRDPTLAITGLEKELIEYIMEADDSKGPLSSWSLFSWLQENDIKTTEAYTEAVEIHENARALWLKTPAKCRIERNTAKENEINNDKSEPAMKTVVEAMVSGVEEECVKHKDLGGLQGKVELLITFGGAEDKSDQDKMRKVMEDIAARIDKVSEISSYEFRRVGILEENAEGLNGRLELLILTLRNILNALEEAIGRVGANDNEPPLTLWESVMELSSHAKTLVNHEEYILIIDEMSEQVTHLAGAIEVNAGAGAVCSNENMGIRVTGSQPLLGNQAKVQARTGLPFDMIVGLHDANGLSQVCLDEIVSLSTALAEVKAKVFGDGGGAGGYDCGPYPIHNPTDAAAVLEPVKVGSVTPHVLLEITYRCLYDNMQPRVRDASALKGMGISALEYWAGGAMQRAIPQLFCTSTPVPGMMYSAVAKARIPAILTRKVFGRDTEDESVYKRILAALDTTPTTLFNHIESALGYGDEQNVCRLCDWMLVRAKKFAEEMFRYMDITCCELEIAFKSEKESWDLVCYCVRKIFATEFKAARDLAAGSGLDYSGAPRCLHSAVKVMCKAAEDFLTVGVRNHPALTAAMVRFVMVMSKEGGSDSSSDDIKELKAGLKALTLEVAAGERERKVLKTKNKYLQSQVDKLKTVAVAKGWKLNGSAN